MTTRLAWPALLAATALLAGCSSGNDSSGDDGEGDAVTAVSSGGVQRATIKGTDSLKFAPATVNAKPGQLELTLDVVGGIPHNLEVDGISGASIANVPGHEQASVKFTATPGTYTLICTYHSAMRGKLVVAP